MSRVFANVLALCTGSMLTIVLSCSSPAEKEDPATVSTDENTPSTSGVEQGVPTLRIGYFNGGRNTLLYRALDDGSFAKAGVQVELWATPFSNAPHFVQLPPTIDAFQKVKKKKKKYKEKFSTLARTTGPEIVAAMERGESDCGAVGESTFLEHVVEYEKPWVAVAQLGHDLDETPGKIVIARTGLEINQPEDFAGLSIASRYSGPFDRVMVREFLEVEGVDPTMMVIHDNVLPTDLHFGLKNQTYDFAFLHLHRAMVMVQNGKYQAYRNFDWIRASVSQALLVCPKSYVEAHRETLIRFMVGYKTRIDLEHALTNAEKEIYTGQKTREMNMLFFDGLNIPQYSSEPLVPLDTLELMQTLLVKHKVVSAKKSVAPYVNNDLMIEALQRYSNKD